MLNSLEPYIDSPKQCEVGSISGRRLSHLESLKETQVRLTRSLVEVEAAIKFLEENPTFTQGLDILAKAVRH